MDFSCVSTNPQWEGLWHKERTHVRETWMKFRWNEKHPLSLWHTLHACLLFVAWGCLSVLVSQFSSCSWVIDFADLSFIDNWFALNKFYYIEQSSFLFYSCICFVVTAGWDGQCSDSFSSLFLLSLNILKIFTFKVSPSFETVLVWLFVPNSRMVLYFNDLINNVDY